ncbi:MAG: Phage tail protein, partial [Rubritepida sp.]|nr:Phage tail protein [Rubritepida sp.]
MTALSEVAALEITVRNQVSEGAAAAARDLDKVEAAADRAAAALKVVESGTRLAGDTFDKTAARSDGLARAEQRRTEITARAQREITALTAAAQTEGLAEDRLAAAIEAVTLKRDADIIRVQRQAEVQRAQQLALVGGASAQTQAMAAGTGAIDKYVASNDNASRGAGKFSQAIGQAGFQLQDFVVQVSSGQSALTALGQQGSQMLGVFGTGGAIAGAALAVGVLIAQLTLGATAGAQLTAEIERQKTQFEESVTRATAYVGALRAQGEQYRSMTAAGQLYRDGLRGEGESLVALTRLYQGMTEARRALEQQGVTTSTRLNSYNQVLVNRQVDSALGANLTRASTSVGAADIMSGLAATEAPTATPDYDVATAALARYRNENDRSVEAVLRLWNGLRDAANMNGDYGASIGRMMGDIEKLIPTLDRLDEATRRVTTRQLALSGQASSLQLRALSDQASGEVGGRSQQMERIRDLRGDLQGGLAGASPEQTGRIRSSLQQLNQQQEGLTPATSQQLRALQEQATLSRTAEGAAKDLATAELELDRAARAAGAGQASAGEKIEARRRVQERLIQTLNNSLVVLNAQITGEQRIGQAYGDSAAAGREMEAQVKAEADALKTAAEGTTLYNQVVATLTVRYRELTAAQAERQLGQRNSQSRDELAYLQREGELVGVNADQRERELAALRARQSAGAAAGSDAAKEAERLAVQLVDVRRNTEQLTNSWTELTSLGERAFDKIGTAITSAFADGSLKAINFGNIAKAVMSEIVQSALKLAVVNPLLNTMFGGSRGTLGGVSQVAGLGGMGLGGSSSGGTITDTSGNVIGQIGNMSSGQTVMGGLRGVNPSDYMSGATPFNTGWGSADSVLNTSVWGNAIGEGTAQFGATNSAIGAMGGGAYGPALPSAVTEAGGSASGVAGGTIGSIGAGAVGVAGGLYGIYSGIQKGGVGGAVGAVGGAATTAMAGASLYASLAGTAAVIPVWGWIAAAVITIIGALLPGQKASGKGQETRVDLASGSLERNGLTGDRYSAENASQS